MLGSILAGGKNAGIVPGGQEECWNRSWRAGRGKNAGIDPDGREECWDRSWRAGRMLESILAGGKNTGIDPGGREEHGLGFRVTWSPRFRYLKKVRKVLRYVLRSLAGGKNAGIDPGVREKCWDRS